MRMAKYVAVLAALALAVAACGDDAADDTTPAGDDDEVSAPEDDGPAAGLDDDVAAVVNDDEISLDDVEQQVESFANNPQVAEALEGPEGEQTLELLRAQVVSTMIINKLAIAAAEDLDNPVTDEDIAAARGELEDETGGAENLATALEAEGMSEDQLTVQLRALAALRNIETALAEGGDADEDDAEEGEEGDAEEGEEGDAEEGDDPETLAQRFIQERLQSADVVINDDIGTWDAQTGQVTPPGGLPQQQPQPQQQSPAPE
ncbi:MAG: SurA N-terminal domain-containing protein [Egibacteraceae bacterium]